MRPLVSAESIGPRYEQLGYIIAGSRHKLKCRCYACQIVRRRAREKAVVKTWFECG